MKLGLKSFLSRPPAQVAVIAAAAAAVAAGALGFMFGWYQGRDALRAQMGDALASLIVPRVPALSGPPSAPGDPPAPPPSKPSWEVDEDKSPVDDSLTVVLALNASKPYFNSIGSPETARLVIRCKEHSTELYVALDEYLGSSQPTDVIYRLDGKPSVTARWSLSTDGKAVFAPTPVELARELAGARKFFARISDFRGSTFDAEFETAGLDKVLPKVASACGWK